MGLEPTVGSPRQGDAMAAMRLPQICKCRTLTLWQSGAVSSFTKTKQNALFFILELNFILLLNAFFKTGGGRRYRTDLDTMLARQRRSPLLPPKWWCMLDSNQLTHRERFYRPPCLSNCIATPLIISTISNADCKEHC